MSQVKSCCQSSAESTVVVSWLVSFAVRFKWRKLVVIGHFFSVDNVRLFRLVNMFFKCTDRSATPFFNKIKCSDRHTSFIGETGKNFKQDWPADVLQRVSAGLSRISVSLLNTLITKYNLSSLSICRKAEKSAIFIHDTRNDVYRRISVGYARRILREPWPYLDIATMCWKIDFNSLKSIIN